MTNKIRNDQNMMLDKVLTGQKYLSLSFFVNPYLSEAWLNG